MTAMPRILTALDASATFEPTARAAQSLATLLNTRVTGLHVLEPDSPDADALSERAGFQVETVASTDVVGTLRRAMDAPDVIMGVVGTRDEPDGTFPVGHVARLLAEQLHVPLLVVPPGSVLGSDGRLRRTLVPLDGLAETTADVEELVRQLMAARVEVVLTHVFDVGHPPRFVDEPQHDYEAWRDEFHSRHEPGANRVELRRGDPWVAVCACAHEIDADLIVLAWSQDLGPGRAAVVRGAMADPTIPTLLLPHTAHTPAPSGLPSVAPSMHSD
jgi:nucleotide-binding universal stress UspA family protein